MHHFDDCQIILHINNSKHIFCPLLVNSRPDRLREIADRFNLDHSAMLDNILYARAYTSKSHTCT